MKDYAEINVLALGSKSFVFGAAHYPTGNVEPSGSSILFSCTSLKIKL